MRIDNQSGASSFRGGPTGFWARRSATRADAGDPIAEGDGIGQTSISIGLPSPDDDLPPSIGIGLPQPPSETDADKDKSFGTGGFFRTDDHLLRSLFGTNSADVKGTNEEGAGGFTRSEASGSTAPSRPQLRDTRFDDLPDGDSGKGESQSAAQTANPAQASDHTNTPDVNAHAAKAEGKSAAKTKDGKGSDGLTDQQREVVSELQRRDTEVHAHEAAHEAAAGALGSGPSFGYTTGPDGKRYAVSGEVSVQIAAGSTPEETIRNAVQVRAAALAPADPSAQDRAVASEASQMEAAARAEMAAMKNAEAQQNAAAVEARHAAAQAADDDAASPVATSPPDATSAPAAPTTTNVSGSGAEAKPTSKPASPTASRRSHNRAIESDAAPATRQDPAELLRQLEFEQQTAYGGWRHLHASSNCSTCAQAAAAYR